MDFSTAGLFVVAGVLLLLYLARRRRRLEGDDRD